MEAYMAMAAVLSSLPAGCSYRVNKKMMTRLRMTQAIGPR
jgi:hypothetical protein